MSVEKLVEKRCQQVQYSGHIFKHTSIIKYQAFLE